MRRRKGLGGVTDAQLQRSARNNINLGRGALIRAGTRSKSCERQFVQLVKASAHLKSAETTIGMMEVATKEKIKLKREHGLAIRTARTTLSRFKDRCFV